MKQYDPSNDRSIPIRIRRFFNRHHEELGTQLVRLFLGRLMGKPWARSVLRFFIKEKEPKVWLIMTGCYNSGTTILKDVLGAHPAIAILPREGVKLTNAFPDMEHGGWARMWYRNIEQSVHVGLTARDARKLAIKDWSFWWNDTAHIYLEKSISHTARLPFIQKMFPEAKFIFVIRNGYAATEGILRRATPSGLAANKLGQKKYPPELCAQQWVTSNEVYYRDKDQIKNLYECRYESFVSDPLEEIRSILKFLDLSDDAVYKNVDGRIGIGDKLFEITDQNSASIARLSSQDHQKISEVIGPMMKLCGYNTES